MDSSTLYIHTCTCCTLKYHGPYPAVNTHLYLLYPGIPWSLPRCMFIATRSIPDFGLSTSSKRWFATSSVTLKQNKIYSARRLLTTFYAFSYLIVGKNSKQIRNTFEKEIKEAKLGFALKSYKDTP